ncbi:male accessory gland serine protease inhibitor-like [Calliphora vicina]|uniref:male accessory gland serine protease inhibitor-like n=1 Tax=Calliphora vicina TaxID=7373 RepID=UPI00325B1FB4
MKFLNILSLLLIALVAYTSAQRCPGSPSNPSCVGAHDGGRRGPRCTARAMWHYSARLRQCHQILYLGCGGNNNRWCTRAACEQRCRRR